MTLNVSIASIVLLLWVVALIALTSETILVWQIHPVNKVKRTVSSLVLALLFTVPCVLFIVWAK